MCLDQSLNCECVLLTLWFGLPGGCPAQSPESDVQRGGGVKPNGLGGRNSRLPATAPNIGRAFAMTQLPVRQRVAISVVRIWAAPRGRKEADANCLFADSATHFAAHHAIDDQDPKEETDAAAEPHDEPGPAERWGRVPHELAARARHRECGFPGTRAAASIRRDSPAAL
jgi:hypothetical protein